MKKEQWILHVDFISYDPNHLSNDSSLNLHIAYDTEKEMNQAYIQYHANIGEHFTLHDAYTILSVEPSLYPVLTEAPAGSAPPPPADDDNPPVD